MSAGALAWHIGLYLSQQWCDRGKWSFWFYIQVIYAWNLILKEHETRNRAAFISCNQTKPNSLVVLRCLTWCHTYLAVCVLSCFSKHYQDLWGDKDCKDWNGKMSLSVNTIVFSFFIQQRAVSVSISLPYVSRYCSMGIKGFQTI